MKVWLAMMVCCGYFGWVDERYLEPVRATSGSIEAVEAPAFIGEQARIAAMDQTD